MHADAANGLLNTWYLNRAFFYGRGVGYAVVWLAVGAVTLTALRRADPQPWLYRIAAPCLILLELSVTFAAIDSTLSLEPEFKSSVYGMLVSAEGVLLALSVAVLAALVVVPMEPEPREDLGKLMLALTIFWAYLDFMQVLVVWNSDLPGEAAWYVHRITSGWAWVAGLIALLHFFIPFFLLLWPQMQRSRRALLTVAAMLVVAEIPRAWWLVLPSSSRGFNWVDIAAMLAVGGLSAGASLAAPRLASMPHLGRHTHA
jgi:Ni/Fe-hydrogenase subunit HybB-like protein